MWKQITIKDVEEFANIAKTSDYSCRNDAVDVVLHSLLYKIGCELFIYEIPEFTSIVGIKYHPDMDMYRIIYTSADFHGVEDLDLWKKASTVNAQFIFDYLKKKDKKARVIKLQGKLLPKNKSWVPNYTEEVEKVLRSVGLIVETDGIYWVFKWRQQ